ncbi:MAG TPA: hypothetical protein PKC09_11960 [Paracoccus sp. (in: a-proteobacteria)]|uniref:hypothetical protein n=1 Tax=uncultured Paracoccus sp. TaxID=189685 RepID=UPI002608F9B0|nr:hypothetical protein [uncultured Paracoccus sp.]HMQ41974.1 hypothetical protein [Paracoccus sp. (in: a-proteobacteria)]HMR37347.1 hypothetical protein [Paracoccus sp. (in: a-proteobacteria)]
MNKPVVTYKPSYVIGAAIALAGLVIAWLLPDFLPPVVANLLAGAITGGFGVAFAARFWPGLPLGQMIQYGPAVAVYGALVGWLAASGS